MNLFRIALAIVIIMASAHADDSSTPKKGQVRIQIGKSQSAKGHKDAKTQAPPAPSAPSNPEYEPPSESRPVSPRPIAPPPVPTTNGPCPYGMVPYIHPREIGLRLYAKNPNSDAIPGLKELLNDWNIRYKKLMGDSFDRLECSPLQDKGLKGLYESWTKEYTTRFVYCKLKLCIPYDKKVVEKVGPNRSAKSVNYESSWQTIERSSSDYATTDREHNRVEGVAKAEAWRNWESDYFGFLKERKGRDASLVGALVIQAKPNFTNHNTGKHRNDGTPEKQSIATRGAGGEVSNTRSNGAITSSVGDYFGVYFEWIPVEIYLE